MRSLCPSALHVQRMCLRETGVWWMDSDEPHGVVESLTLIARMEKGELAFLQWHDQRCSACGGGVEPPHVCMEVRRLPSSV